MGAQKVGALDREALYVALDRKRRYERLSGRELLRRAGVDTPSTWTRLARGAEVSLDTFLRLLAWLGESDVRPYSTLQHEAAAAQRPAAGDNSNALDREVV